MGPEPTGAISKPSAVQAKSQLRYWNDVVGPDRADGRTDCEELSGVCAPGMVSLTQVNADDALCMQRLGFGLHASHREFTRVVQRLRELRELGVLAEIGQHVAERAM